MIDYIIYGEFDINEGNVIKVEYPRKTGVNEMVLASYLIPEGTHNIMNDCFCFIINRNENDFNSITSSTKNVLNSFQSNTIKYIDLKRTYNKDKVYQLKNLYKLSTLNNWENYFDNMVENNLYLKIKNDDKRSTYNIVVYDKTTDELLLSM